VPAPVPAPTPAPAPIPLSAVPTPVQAALIKWAAQPVPEPVPAPTPVPVPIPLSAVAAPPPTAVSGVKLPASLTSLDNQATDGFNKIASGVRGAAETIKGEGQRVYHKVEGESKQALQKFNNLPQEQKVGIEVGSAVGVAALAGAVGGIAEAAHQADVKKAKKQKLEAKKQKLEAKMKATTEAPTSPPTPTVVTVPVIVRVPVTPAPKYIFAWPRLFERGDAKQAGITMAQGTLMGAAALVFLACALLGVSFIVYLKNRSESRSLSRVECEDDGNPLLA